MARSLPEFFAHHRRRLDFDIPILALAFAQEFDQLIPNDDPVGMDEGHSRGLFFEGEEIEGGANDLMVSLFRLFEKLDILFEPLLVREGDRIDAGQHLPIRVSAPIGARSLQHFERFDFIESRHVGSAAKVEKFPLPIGRDRLFRKSIDQFVFIGIF